MSRNYKFHNPRAPYFVSFAVVEWLDVFTRNEYKDILIDSLTYCQKEKGMPACCHSQTGKFTPGAS